jgi:4-hydroxy-3-polyprenylbenzoate decarboxylase
MEQYSESGIRTSWDAVLLFQYFVVPLSLKSGMFFAMSRHAGGNLVLALTGATGAVAARMLVEKSPWPVTLIASAWGKIVYEKECGPFAELARKVDQVYDDADLAAPVSSGSVATVGMVILPCSCNTLGEIASGVASSLIARAAHCHLKERRPFVLCLREAPLSLIDLRNAVTVSEAGGLVMPMSPPYYMLDTAQPETVNLRQLLDIYIDRVLALLGKPAGRTWEDVR